MDPDDRFTLPTMKEAVYEYELVRRKIGNPLVRADSPEKMADWLRKHWAGRATNELIVIAVNNENQVLGYQTLLDGGAVPTGGPAIYSLDAVIRPILQLGMRRFVLAQFQSQNTAPDLQGLDELIVSTGRIAGLVGLEFIDMVVVAGDEWVSARMTGHGKENPLHSLAHSIIDDLGGTEEDHARLDEHEPDDNKWALDVLKELVLRVPTDVIERVTERLESLIIELMGGPRQQAEVEKLPDGFLSLEDLMGSPEASEPLIDTDEEE